VVASRAKVDVVALNLSRVHPKLRTIARNLPRVAASQGFEVRVTSGWRSYSNQAKLYRDYLNGVSHYPANPPGTSEHEKGLALDILSTNTSRLVDILASVGLYWAGPADPIHFQLKPLQRQAAISLRTNELAPVNTPARLSFGQSFMKSVNSIERFFIGEW
jgi:hypothetical protein